MSEYAHVKACITVQDIIKKTQLAIKGMGPTQENAECTKLICGGVCVAV